VSEPQSATKAQPENFDLNQAARLAAHMLRDAFNAYYGAFLDITRRAKSRFEHREWEAVLRDAEERIGLYHDHLNAAEAEVETILQDRSTAPEVWQQIKREYLPPYLNYYHADLALIFFYSVMRRAFLHKGDSIEYSDDEIRESLKSRLRETELKPYRAYTLDTVTPQTFKRLVQDYGFETPFFDLDAGAALAAEALNAELRDQLSAASIDRIEMLLHPFYRNKAAYLIGRIRSGNHVVPLVLVLLHPEKGIVIDAVLTAEEDVSNVFTSARSNFHVDAYAYREVFRFLQSIAPSRPKPYLYAAIGFIHPAKLELVKGLRAHLAGTDERFQFAEGIPGTVMVTFRLPSFDYVFKVIRDTSPKQTFQGRAHVVRQYWKVHRMDRVGRMLDIMTFHNLRFRRASFDPALLDELLETAPGSARVEEDAVVFRYLYAERKIVPLDVYLRDAPVPEEQRQHAVLDYGAAIRDLAAAGLFVGDYMTKNFGVSQYTRVILYDYDDMDDLVNWNFRSLPEPPEWAELLPYEDWLSKGPFDVFPEHDFRKFAVPEQYLEFFTRHHGELLNPGFWNRIKSELREGHVPDFYPYPGSKRLRALSAAVQPT